MTTYNTKSLDALEKARAAARAKREAGEETILPRLTPIEASQADPTSRAKAIKAKCYECMGGEESDNWKKDVKHCSSYGCPLRGLRPFQ